MGCIVVVRSNLWDRWVELGVSPKRQNVSACARIDSVAKEIYIDYDEH